MNGCEKREMSREKVEMEKGARTMEVPEDILEVLKCRKCEGFLSRSPVYLCADGSGLCSICFTAEQPEPATRNTHYEAVAKLLLFPCKNQDEGCTVKVPFNNPSEHEEVCLQRKYVCPVLGSSACDWSGTAAHILEHCEQQHADRVLDNVTTFTHDITKSSSDTYLLRAFQLLFLLFTKVCVKSGKIYYSIRYLGSSSDVQNFKYTLNITRGNETVIKEGKVAPQGCLAIQEDSSVILNINSLLSIFEGFNNTSFTVILERLVAGTKCSKCGILLKVNDYHDLEGWKCEHCAPQKVICKNYNKGCKYKAFQLKCIKHERHFCDYANYCYNCEKTVNDQVLIHYEKEHFKCSSGSKWRAHERNETRYIIQSDAGTAVCIYQWKDSFFNFYISTSIPNDQLINYRYTVKVTQVATGQTRTYNPSPDYCTVYDLFIKVMNTDFSDWSDTFDISVSFTKIK